MRYFDRDNNRLVYVEQAATPAFWDQQWEDEQLKKSVLGGASDRFVFPITRRYLPLGSKILEGGCGKGQFVYSLHARGYQAIGVDFAEKTVARIRALIPELTIQLGDVRKLDFPNDSFDGYWSLGVIEHFYHGYAPIAEEMRRILKPGGYLFLTFPYMSPLRRLKAWLGSYPTFDPNGFKHELFYQFALDHKRVARYYTELGFDLIATRPYEGFKGFKDESGPLKPFLQRMYNANNFFVQATGYILAQLLAPFSGHTVLLILRKKL